MSYYKFANKLNTCCKFAKWFGGAAPLHSPMAIPLKMLNASITHSQCHHNWCDNISYVHLAVQILDLGWKIQSWPVRLCVVGGGGVVIRMSSYESFLKRDMSVLKSSWWSAIIEWKYKCFCILSTFYSVNHMEGMIDIEEDITLMQTMIEDHLIPSGSKLLWVYLLLLQGRSILDTHFFKESGF